MAFCHVGLVFAFFGALAFVFSLHVIHVNLMEFVFIQLIAIVFFMSGIFCVAQEHFSGRPVLTRVDSIELARIDRLNEILNGTSLESLKEDDARKIDKLPSYEEATRDLPSYKEVAKA
jgi:hypothetical protein